MTNGMGPVDLEVLENITRDLGRKISREKHEKMYDFHGDGVWVYVAYTPSGLANIHTEEPVYIPLDGTYIVAPDLTFYKEVMKNSNRDTPCIAVVHHYLMIDTSIAGRMGISHSTQWNMASAVLKE